MKINYRGETHEKYIRSATTSQEIDYDSNDWPSADEWYDAYDEEFEDMWSSYLAGPEDEVNKELQIFTEPSVQGGMGGMFIFDESGEDRESFSIDFEYWCDSERDMAAESNDAIEYKQKYRDFIEAELTDEDWI